MTEREFEVGVYLGDSGQAFMRPQCTRAGCGAKGISLYKSDVKDWKEVGETDPISAWVDAHQAECVALGAS